MGAPNRSEMLVMSNEQEERWYVQFDSEEVRLMTLEELDDAFQKGLVHEETYVIPVGASEWQTLGELLGMGGEEEAAEPAPVPSAPAPTSARSMGSAPPAPSSVRPPGAVTGVMPAISPPVAAAGAQPPAFVSRWAAAPTSEWPPVAVAPTKVDASSPSNLPSYKPAQSVIPVVQDVTSADVDAAEFKPKKSRLVFVALGAAAAIGAIGVGIARLDAPPTAQAAQPPAAAAAPVPYTPPQPSPPSTPPTPATAAEPTTPAPSTPSTDASSASANDRLSEDMKKALLAQDDDRSQKKKGRTKATARRATSKSSAAASKTPLKGGGSTHDPLDPNL